jgi:nucleotide-binding universal stress UspA family protein
MAGEARPVVVGVDESPASRGALWWAVREARMRHSRLLIAHATTVATAGTERAQAVADDAVAFARALAPDLSVDMVIDDRPAGRALCRLSREATLVVVASRGLGGFTRLLVSSVSSYVASHGECPVLVVHGGERWAAPETLDGSTLPVLVGIGPYGRPAPALEPLVDFAFTEAHLRGVDLMALRAWNPPPPPWRSDVRPLVADVAELETSEEVDLMDAVLPVPAEVSRCDSPAPGGADRCRSCPRRRRGICPTRGGGHAPQPCRRPAPGIGEPAGAAPRAGLGGARAVGYRGQVRAPGRCLMNTPHWPNDPVVVAVTGTPADVPAIHLAAAEAILRHRPLHVLATYEPPPEPADRAASATVLAGARLAMTEAALWLRSAHPGLPVDCRVLPGDPAVLLVTRSGAAEEVVVPVSTPVRGVATVGERVAAYARCPVLISHTGSTPGGDVVVALDGIAPAEPLLSYGFDTAALRGVPLRPLLVWNALPDAAFGTLNPFAFDRSAADLEADRLLAEELAGWSEKYPDVVVHRQALHAPDVATALDHFSADAGLLVVGARSPAAHGGTALGGVTRRLVRVARCPVAVVRLGAEPKGSK